PTHRRPEPAFRRWPGLRHRTGLATRHHATRRRSTVFRSLTRAQNHENSCVHPKTSPCTLQPRPRLTAEHDAIDRAQLTRSVQALAMPPVRVRCPRISPSVMHGAPVFDGREVWLLDIA